MIHNCKTCKKDFVKNHNKTRVYTYCSCLCAGRNLDRIKKYSKIMKGKATWNKGQTGRKQWHNILGLKPGWNKGLVGVGAVGEKNGKWIKDRNVVLDNCNKDTTEYRNWRLAVYKRDGWKCKIGNKECKGRIEAHHILPWRSHKELRYEINNGITLCHYHHPRKAIDEVKLSPYFTGLVAVTVQA